MLFIERSSFLSCKGLLGGYSRNSYGLLWYWALEEMLQSLPRHAGKGQEHHFGAAVDCMSTSFVYVWGTGDFLI